MANSETLLTSFDQQSVLNIASENSSSSILDISNQRELQVTEEFSLPHLVGDTRTDSMELPPLCFNETSSSQYDMSFAGNYIINQQATSEYAPFDTWTWPYSVIQPHLGNELQAPWSTWTRIAEQPPTSYTPNPGNRLSFTPSNCLSLLRQSNEVVQHTSNLVVQALRSYPLMMLRRETLPPFIHPHWYSLSTPALPEPISNCMSIAQMYAFRSEETKPFLWRTIKAECQRFREQVTTSYFY